MYEKNIDRKTRHCIAGLEVNKKPGNKQQHFKMRNVQRLFSFSFVLPLPFQLVGKKMDFWKGFN